MDNEPNSDVRVSHSRNDAETDYVTMRKKTCQNTLRKFGINCTEDEVPNIAVIASGGCLRAMVALLGSLCQLEKEGLLDAIMYLSGVSGSTWAMASLYKEPNWSDNLKSIIEKITERLINGEVPYGMQFEKLRQYYQKDNFSLTDVWAVFISGILKDIDEHVLTEQRNKHNADPYPIFNVIDKQCADKKQFKDVWFEITPDESGYSLGGAFVDTAFLGSEYDNGTRSKRCLEDDMLYLQGLCGSAPAEIEKLIWNCLKSYVKWLFSQSEEPEVKEQCELIQALLDLILFPLNEKHSNLSTIQNLIKDEKYAGSQLADKILKLKNKKMTEMTEKDVIEFIVSACEAFLSFGWITDIQMILTIIKLASHWIWGTTYNIVYDMKVEDIEPTVMETKIREYVDAGLLLNSPYFSVLRNHRKVDLIISLDFSGGDPFETVKTAAKLCEELKMPFPKVSPIDYDPKDFYVYNSDSAAPVVIHIPLFNRVNCNGDIPWWEDKYSSTTLSYTREMITALMEKSALNISNNKEKLLKAIKDTVQKKK